MSETMSIWRRSGLAIALAACMLPALADPQGPAVTAALTLIAAWAWTLRTPQRPVMALARVRR